VYNPNESRPDREKQRVARLATMAGLALVLAAGMLLQRPLGAMAGIASGGGDRNAFHVLPPAAAPSQKAPPAYQLRCWQYGQLLFDEGPLTLSAEARRGATLVAIDRHGAALIVTDSGETTCLASPFAAPPNLALPR
jgi:hypothetical protein